MNIDIVLSVKEISNRIESCIESISENDYNLKEITIIIVDSQLTSLQDSTLKRLEIKYKSIFKDVQLIIPSKKCSKKRANYLGYLAGNSDYALFLSDLLSFTPSALKVIASNIINSSSECALWQLKKSFDNISIFEPISLDVYWYKGNTFIIKRRFFQELFKSQKNFKKFSDIDINLYILRKEYKMKFISNNILLSDGKVNQNEDIDNLIGDLLISWYLLDLKDLITKYFNYFILFIRRRYKNKRRYISLCFLFHLVKIIPCLANGLIGKKRKEKRILFKFNGFLNDYKIESHNKTLMILSTNRPKVSIIVRTCGRPNVLRETLVSIRNQTYQNIEVVVYEDGENTSEKIIKHEFADLDIVYNYSGKKIGRCAAGNNALRLATGKYLNFLDDDDIFLPEHIETLVMNLENSNKRVAYSLALETPIKVSSYEPYIYQVYDYNLTYKQPFNRLFLFLGNYLPIQSVMFNREVFLSEGGFDENLNVLEDWDLWMRFACKEDFLFINKITSIYRVPYHVKQINKRELEFANSIHLVREKQRSYTSQINVYNSALEIQEIIDCCVYKNNDSLPIKKRIAVYFIRIKGIIKKVVKHLLKIK